MKTYRHQCIKNGCGQAYTDEDMDAYFCPTCQDANKAVAEKVDAQFKGAPKVKPLSALQEYDAAAENIHGMKLLRVK